MVNDKKSIDLLLIHPPYHRRRGSSVVFPLGLGYLSSAAKNAGFSTQILDCAADFGSLHNDSIEKFTQWLCERLKQIKPILAIGVGPCTTSSIKAICLISKICKKVFPQVPLLYGGPLASIPGQDPIFFEDLSATAIVPGDGERVLCNILLALREHKPLGALEGVQTATSGSKPANVISDIDNIIFPDRESILKDNRYHLSVRRDLFANPFISMCTSRGCRYKCPFCVSSCLRGGVYDRRSFENVVEELLGLQKLVEYGTVVFYDDTFFSSADVLESETINIYNGMKKLPIPVIWQAEMRPDVVIAVDKPLAAMLYKAGCRQINIGIEKAHSKNAAALGKTINTAKLHQSCNRIHEGAPNMRLTSTFILGGPGETMDTIKETIELSTSIGLLFAHFYPLELYPGTQLYREYFGENSDTAWYTKIMSDPLPWGEVIYESNELCREKILNCVNKAYEIFYNRDEWCKLAKLSLGDRYGEIAQIVSTWTTDRFALNERRR